MDLKPSKIRRISFVSVYDGTYTIVNTQKHKGKALKKHILKNIAPRGFTATISEIQGVQAEIWQSTIIHLRERHVHHARFSGKDHIIIITRISELLSLISIIIYYIKYQKYNDVRGM